MTRSLLRRPATRYGTMLLALMLAFSQAACDDNPVTPPEGVPATHTVRKDGRYHAPGLASPQENCAGCHGQDLRGGDEGQPSCYSCHGQKW